MQMRSVGQRAQTSPGEKQKGACDWRAVSEPGSPCRRCLGPGSAVVESKPFFSGLLVASCDQRKHICPSPAPGCEDSRSINSGKPVSCGLKAVAGRAQPVVGASLKGGRSFSLSPKVGSDPTPTGHFCISHQIDVVLFRPSGGVGTGTHTFGLSVCPGRRPVCPGIRREAVGSILLFDLVPVAFPESVTVAGVAFT